MTKFTPGPWTYRTNKFSDWGEVNAFGAVILKCNAHIGPVVNGELTLNDLSAFRALNGRDPVEANARLAAAAPALYEALDAVHNEMCVSGYGDPINGVVTDEVEYERRIRGLVESALKAARGEE